MRINAAIYVALALTGCALFVKTNIEVFHDLPNDYPGKTISVVAADPSRADTIEFRTYASKLAAQLTDAGFVVVPPDVDDPPDYVAAFAYGVGPQQAGGAHTTGTITPDYAGGGWFHGVTTIARKHPRALVLGIVRVPRRENEEPEQVYTMTALSTGKCRALSTVIDPMLDAVFSDFPGESGKATTVTVPTPGLVC